MLSCYCDDSLEPGDIVWYSPNDYTKLKTERAKRCVSCGALIKVGDICTAITRYKIPKHDVEIKIYSEEGEIPRATAYQCEACADLYFSLSEYGYCVNALADQRELLKEHATRFNSGWMR